MRKNKFSQKIMHTKSKINAVQSFHDIFGARTFWRALSISDLKSLINVDTFCTFNHWDYSKTHETRSIWRFSKIPFFSKFLKKTGFFKLFSCFFELHFWVFGGIACYFGTLFSPFLAFQSTLQKNITRGCPWGQYGVLHTTRFFLWVVSL